MAYIGNIPKTGNQRKIDSPLDRVGGGAGFNGVSRDFLLRVGGDPVYPGAYQVLVVIGGEIKEPAKHYNINNDTIVFTQGNAPSQADESTFFAVILGDRLDVGTVSDASIIGTKIVDGAITGNKIGNLQISVDKLQDNSVQTSKIKDNNVTSSKLDQTTGAVTPPTLNLGGYAPGSLPNAQRVGQFAADTNGDYWLTKDVSGTVTWTPLVNQQTILSYVGYGSAVNTTGFTIDGSTNKLNTNYMLDSTSAPYTISISAAPSIGNFIRLVDVTNKWSINNITVDASASSKEFKDYLDSVDSELLLDTNGWEVLLVYNGVNWKIVT